MVPWASPYDSVTPSGRVLFRLPLRVRFRVMEAVEMSELDTTVRPLAFAPDSDQPAPPVSAVLTGSSKVTRMVLSEVALASSMRGAWASTRRCEADVSAPSALPYASSSAVWLTVRRPSAFVASAPPNERTCEAVPLPDTPVIGRVSPGDSTTFGYACAPAPTGSV